MSGEITKGEIYKAFSEYLDQFRVESGAIDLQAILVNTMADKSAPQIADKVYTAYSNWKTGFTQRYPILERAETIEVNGLLGISEIAFPYWFAVDNFAEPVGKTCQEDFAMCMPMAGLVELYIYKQTRGLIVVCFVVVLSAVLLAAIVSGRKRKYSKLRCFFMFTFALIVDTIGAVSLLYPLFGNIFDVFWAPIAGALTSLITLSPAAGLLVLFKELSIFLDLIPLATVLAIHYMLE